MLVKLEIYNKVSSKKKKYESKLYQPMRYPGERVQVNVKYVPKASMTKELIERNERYYQYTAIDEYTRQRVIWFAKEHSTYESSKFIEIIVKKFKYKIEEIQTDNGFEFTKRLQYKNDLNIPKTLFEEKLKELNIKHKLIKPYTPMHNGKLERSHKKDKERFYYNKVFFSFEDLVNRAKYYIKEYNIFPMRPLPWLSQNDKYEKYIRNASSIIA